VRCPYCGGDYTAGGACQSCGRRPDNDNPRSFFDVDSSASTQNLLQRGRARQQESVRLFAQTECSWCRKFYTQPFLCPHGRLQSSCISRDNLNEEQRDSFLSERKWHFRIAEMLRQVREYGIMAKCRARACGALNPNPQNLVCWRCKRDTICCPRDGLVLRYDIEGKFWKCTNAGCPTTYVDFHEVPPTPHTSTEQDRKSQEKLAQESSSTEQPLSVSAASAAKPPAPSVAPPAKQAAKAVTARHAAAMPKWVYPLLLVFALSVAGIAASVIIGTSIPFWLLFGFAAFFSAEKWFTYDTRKNKTLGQLYRTVLNLSILSLMGLLVWSGIVLFGQRFLSSPLAGALVFLAEFVFFVWMWRVVARNSWRRPSMKLTVFTIIVVFVVLAFAGVKPLSTYKDTAWNKIKSAFSSVNNGSPQEPVSPSVLTTSVKPVTVNPATPSQPITPTTTTQTINSRTGVYKNYYLGLVDDRSGTLGGNGCYDDMGNFIVLINNKNATNPTYYQLVTFLQNDKVDQYPYTYTNRTAGLYYGTAESRVDLNRIKDIIDRVAQPSNPDVCADFAERLHNDAEMAGIRCAYVSLEMTGYTDPLHLGIPANGGHACNAFQTTDRGLIYVDATGMSPNIPHPSRPISTVNIAVGQQYIPISLFSEAGWQSASESMGTVTNIFMTWDGNWNN